MSTLQPLWRDYSRWQGLVNYDVAVANGVQGMAARAGISWAYVDPWFETNWNAAGQQDGFYRTSYHVIWPDQDVVKQADSWFKVHPIRDVVPRVIDLEVDRDQPASKIADKTWAMSEIVLARDGIRPIIYSRYLLINKWLASWTAEQLNEHWYWLAQYHWTRIIEHSGPPTLPAWVARDRVVLHQTADKKPAPSGETQSRTVDWNRWQKGLEGQQDQWIAENWGDGQVVPPPPQPGIKLVKVTATALNIRMEPDASSQDIGTLVGGSVVAVKDQPGTWLQLHDGWIHGDYVADEQ